MIMTKKQLKIAVIYNQSMQTKAEIRSEIADVLAQFLARGGRIEVVKAKKVPKQKMRVSNSRGFQSGTSGFAVGYPSKSM